MLPILVKVNIRTGCIANSISRPTFEYYAVNLNGLSEVRIQISMKIKMPFLKITFHALFYYPESFFFIGYILLKELEN